MSLGTPHNRHISQYSVLQVSSKYNNCFFFPVLQTFSLFIKICKIHLFSQPQNGFPWRLWWDVTSDAIGWMVFGIFLYLFRKAHLSSKKLLEQCQKLEKLWTHVYTGTLNLTSITAESQWYTKLTDLIDKQQTAPIWMSESKVIIFSFSKVSFRN